MTKLRAPLSVHHAVKVIVDHVGIGEVARHFGRSESAVLGWTDAGRRGSITFEVGRKLDRLYLAANGAYPPIAATYMADLQLFAAQSFFVGKARVELAARAAIEAGEASAACLQAYAGNGSRDALLSAERETEEAIMAHAASLHAIRHELGAHGIERSW